MTLFERFLFWVSKHLPENRISFDGDVYLRRFYLCGKLPESLKSYFGHGPAPRERLGWLESTVYLHCFLRPDKDRDLHNHPWNAKSRVLVGGYVEERYIGHPREPGAYKALCAVERFGVNHIHTDDFHRIDALDTERVWTLFTVGEKMQTWGFWVEDEQRFVPHREYAASGEKLRHHEPKEKS